MDQSESSSVKLNEDLKCGVCLDRYTDPRILPCHHSFCLECLESFTKHGRRSVPFERVPLRPLQTEDEDDYNLYIQCPVCIQDAKIPHGGPKNFPPDFRSNESATPSPVTLPIPGAGANGIHYCPDHADQKLKMYCETCEQLICYECIAVDSRHRNGDHVVKDIENCFLEQLKILRKELRTVKKGIHAFDGKEILLEEQEAQLSRQEEKIRNQIHQHAQELIRMVNQAEEKLQAQLKDVVQRKKNSVLEQKRAMGNSLQQLRDCQTSIEETVKRRDKVLILERKREIMKQTSLAIKCSPHAVVPIEKADIDVVGLSYFKEDMLGTLDYSEFEKASILTPENDPSFSVVAGTTLKATIVLQSKKETPFEVFHRYNYQCEGWNHPIYCYAIPLNGDLSSAVECDVTVRDASLGRYDVSFTPLVRGQYNMALKVGGIDVSHNEIVFNVVPTPKMRGVLVDHPILGLKEPIDVAVDENGNLYIVEKGANQILVYKNNQEKIVLSKELKCPAGIAITKDGNIVVTDKHRLLLLKLHSEGNVTLLNIVGSDRAGSKDTRFHNPMGVAVCPKSGNIFVADCGNNRVQMFDKNLKSLDHFYGHGYFGMGSFKNPCALSVDRDGFLYLIQQRDDKRQALLKLTDTGSLKVDFIEANQDRLIRGLASIAVGNGVVYVSDPVNDCITAFNSSNGKFINTFQTITAKLAGIALDKLGNLYVISGAGVSVY